MFENETDLGRLEWYAEVILPLPLHGTFTYRVGRDIENFIQIGARVMVPFGKSKIYTGIVLSIHNQSPTSYSVHYIQELLDIEKPLISKQIINHWQWIASYYMSPLGEVMNAGLTAALKFSSLTYVSLNPEIFWEDEQLSSEEIMLMKWIESKPKISILELEVNTKSKSSLLKQIRNLYRKDLIFITEEFHTIYKPKKEKWVGVSSNFKEAEYSKNTIDALYKKSKIQYNILLTLFGIADRKASWNFLTKEKNFSKSTLKTMIKNGILIEENLAVSRLTSTTKAENAKFNELTEAQILSVNKIIEIWKEKTCILLHAPTGSGKTHVYIDLIQKELEKGKQVLLLIPEIALTQQLLERLENYFQDKLFVFHSQYGLQAKTEVWKKVNEGESMLVLGPRSAALLPFCNLSLVIIDEEHESTYKQNDKLPRFNGKDIAIKLAYDLKAKVLLGTATPSFESWHNVQENKWGLVELDQRFGNFKNTKMLLANISANAKIQGKKDFLTKELVQEIKNQIEKGKQILLFQNRKGYVPLLECGNCEWTPKCVNCDISLTYYKNSNSLRCHYCGFNKEVVSKCDACNSNDMRFWGYGTERIEEEIELRFPGLVIRRFDQDTARKKEIQSKILKDFEEGKIHILVGTQLLIKGIDFGNVGLAAVISLDQMLNMPDFRASERAFQMMVQLAGRAGRRDGEGLLFIQTGKPENPIFKHLLNFDYRSFYLEEIEIRKELNFPPFCRIIKIVIQHKDKLLCDAGAALFAQQLRVFLKEKVLGPEEPYVGKIKNLYVRNIIVKLDTHKDPINQIKTWLLDYSLEFCNAKDFKMLRISFDVDPYY